MPDGIGTPAGLQDADELLHARTTLVKVRADGRVLLLGPSGTEAHNEPASGELVDGGQSCGKLHRPVIPGHEHARAQRLFRRNHGR